MIVSASRRTDIPSYYSEWFFRRLGEGYALVRNPMNPHRVSRIALNPDVVDGIVFWTKNPIPMMDRLDLLRDYAYYFQFTLTPYGDDVEVNIPSKQEVMLDAFRRLSSMIGRERVLWRYDPIFISERYSVRFHIDAFRDMCDSLAGDTDICTISFLDLYRNIQSRITPHGIRPPTAGEVAEIAGRFAEIAKAYSLNINTCAEDADLSQYGIGHGACIDVHRLEQIGNLRLLAEQDKNQRKACGCAASIDIGAYNTCQNGCVYCYANFNRMPMSRYDPSSPLLCGEITDADTVTEREVKTCRVEQMSLFD